VRVHACRRDPELGGDLFGRPPGRDRSEDLALAIGQRVDRGARLQHGSGDEVARDHADRERSDALAMHLTR